MKRVATIVIVNVGLFALLWLGLEAVARRFAPRDVRAVFNDPSLRTGPLVVPDSVRGFALKPGYALDWLHINAAGFRGPELPLDLRARTVVLAMGESSTFGWGVSDSESCPARLQRALERMPGTPPVWVINAGVPSYTSPQVLLYLKQLLPRYRPAVVLTREHFANVANPLFKLILAQYHAHKGERDEVEALIDDDLMKTVNRDIQYPWHLSIAWLLLGEKEKALSLLEDAVTGGFWNYRFLGEYDPYVAQLRGDPRFDALMKKAKAEAERV